MEEKKGIQYIYPIIIIIITSILLIDPLVMDSDFILVSFVNDQHEMNSPTVPEQVYKVISKHSFGSLVVENRDEKFVKSTVHV